MPTLNVGAMLKNKRISCGMSVKDVISSLSDCGVNISEKTLYGWESGHRMPDADTFLLLCKIYRIEDVIDYFWEESKVEPIELSGHETELVIAYRKQPDMQKSVDKLLGIEQPKEKK